MSGDFLFGISEFFRAAFGELEEPLDFPESQRRAPRRVLRIGAVFRRVIWGVGVYPRAQIRKFPFIELHAVVPRADHLHYSALFRAPRVRLLHGVGARAYRGYRLLRMQLQIGLVEHQPPVAAEDYLSRAPAAEVMAFHAVPVENRLDVLHVGELRARDAARLGKDFARLSLQRNRRLQARRRGRIAGFVAARARRYFARENRDPAAHCLNHVAVCVESLEV